jgi:glycosyltransferase involved in cell wall biosynthesis
MPAADAGAKAATALAGADGRRLIEAGIYWQSVQDARLRVERETPDAPADPDADPRLSTGAARDASAGEPDDVTPASKGAHAGAEVQPDVARETAGAHAGAAGAQEPGTAPEVIRRYARRLIELVPSADWLRLTEENRLVLLELGTVTSGPRVGVLGPSLARRRAERRTARVTPTARGGAVELRARLDGGGDVPLRIVAESPPGAIPASNVEPSLVVEAFDESGAILVKPGPGGHGPSIPVRVRVEISDPTTGSWDPVPTLIEHPATATTAAATTAAATATVTQAASEAATQPATAAETAIATMAATASATEAMPPAATMPAVPPVSTPGALTAATARRVLPGPDPDTFHLRPTLVHRLRARTHHIATDDGAREVIAFPYYPNNPFQSIIYADLTPSFTLSTPETVADLVAELERDAPTGRILHLNWTAPIVQYAATTPEEALAEAERFLVALDGFSERGGLIVWTVHNTMPHEVRFRDAELRLSRGIVDRADAVVTMNPATAALVQHDYPLPADRTAVHEHPSYRGRFRDEVTKGEARRALGIEPEAEVLLLFGTLRPYKGIGRVLGDFARARAERPNLVLLVAGEIGPGFDDDELRHLFDLEGVLPYLRYVPSDDAQFWLRAADAMMLPYSSALNPSLVYLAATFGIPVLLSNLPSLRHLFDEPWVHPVDFEQPVDLVALLDQIAAQRTVAEAAADEFARRTDPAVVAARFAEFLAQLQPRTRSAPTG